MEPQPDLDDLFNLLDDNDMSFIKNSVSDSPEVEENLLDQLTRDILDEKQFPNEEPVIEPIQFTLTPTSEEGLSCDACGQPAGKHTYYGGRACHSCRAFFRRSVQSGRYTSFSCDVGKNCAVDSKSWKSCQRCRFANCEAAGMKANQVLSESQRIARRKKNPVRVVPEMSVALIKPPDSIFTLEERVYIQRLFKSSTDYLGSVAMHYFMDHISHFQEITNYFVRKEPISSRCMLDIELHSWKTAGDFFKQMGDMQELSEADQNALIECNYPKAIEVLLSPTLINKQASSRFVQDMVINPAKNAPIAGPEAENAIMKFEAMNISSDIEFDDYFEKHLDFKPKESERHKELTMLLSGWTDQGIDDILGMLLILLTMFSSDNVSIEGKEKVEQIRYKYASILHKYLRTRYKRPGHEVERETRFKHAMLMGEYAGEALSMKQEKYDKLEAEELKNYSN